MTTVRDVAKLAGVSTATVSRVVNEAGTVSTETRDRVLKAVSRLQFRPNVSAANLARNRGFRKKRRPKGAGSEDGSSMHSSGPEASTAEWCRSLKEENSRLKCLIAKLLADLDRRRKPDNNAK
jgi:hypothetical protein